MSPKTFLDKQDNQQEIKEELDQTSTKKNNQVNLNMANNQKKSDDIILNLGFNLRDDLVAHFLKFSNLLKGVPIDAGDKRELIEMNKDLYHRLSCVSFNDYEDNMRDNLGSIGNDLVVDLTIDERGLFYEMKNETRCEIVDLLMRNLSALCLLNDCVSDEDKNNLIIQNNDLVQRLLYLKAKPFCDNLKIIEYDSDDDKKHYDCPSKRIDVRSNETTFHFVIEDVEEFVKARKVVCSGDFFCSSIKWYLKAISNYEREGKKWIEVYLCAKVDDDSCDWSITTSYKLHLVHPTNETLNVPYLANNILFKNGPSSSSGKNEFVLYDKLVDFTKDNKIKLRAYLKVENVSVKLN